MFKIRVVGFTLVAMCIAFTFGAGTAPAGPPNETAEDRDARMAWWREARFGLFIHWGLYAIPAGEWNGRTIPGVGEWIMHFGQIPVAEYEPLKDRFNPTKFDADAWVRLAKDAGMRYLIITTKHHDGFALFASEHSDYDIEATPYGRDIMKQIADACRRHGLKIGWYHSILDWHHPHANAEDWPKYHDVLVKQCAELLTDYGPIDVLWFDGEWDANWTEEQGRALEQRLHELQPNIIINNRIGKSRQGMAGMSANRESAGDFGTPEQEVPARGLPGVDWESCMTMNDSWGFKKSDHNWKSSDQLIRTLVDIASKGGNFLLNVGPTAEGEIPPESVERLRDIGDWLEVNGEAIYGTAASPFPRLDWGRCTRKGNTLYLHVFDRPANGTLLLPGLRNKVLRARVLEFSASALDHQQTENGVTVQLPANQVVPPVTVIALDVEGELVVETPPVMPDANGRLELRAVDAVIDGHSARYESGEGKDNIGYWTNASDAVEWTFTTKKAQRYALTITLACPMESAGSRYRVRIGDVSATGVVQSTGSWTDFATRGLGNIELPAGTHILRVEVIDMPAGAVMNLQRITLDAR